MLWTRRVVYQILAALLAWTILLPVAPVSGQT
jgi:hypothetical protein